jgi:hypothetical protein
MPLFIVSLPDLPATMRHVVSSSSRLGVVHFADLSVDCENRGQSPGCRYEICRFEHDDAAIVAGSSGLAFQDVVRDLHRRADIGQYVVDSFSHRVRHHIPVRSEAGLRITVSRQLLIP